MDPTSDELSDLLLCTFSFMIIKNNFNVSEEPKMFSLYVHVSTLEYVGEHRQPAILKKIFKP